MAAHHTSDRRGPDADELSELRARLESAEETLRAIRHGEIDALVVDDGSGARLYTLVSADAPYRALVEQMDEGAATLDTNGGVVYCNRRLAEMLGAPIPKVIGASIAQLVDRADESKLAQFVKQGVGKLRMRLRGPQGQTLEVHASISPVLLEGKSYRTLIVTDISTLAQVQRENRSKDEFLAMLAHELRNPLAPIRTAVQLLRDFPLDEEQSRRTLDMIGRQVTHLTRLVDDLLDVSRITQGKVILEKVPVELNAVLTSAIELVRPAVDAKHHRLTLTLPHEALYVAGDAARLTQVLSNLLNNATKYSDEEASIAVSAERAGASTLVRVRDNGIGISPELLPFIFDLFTQEERSLDRAQGGLGIGLALVKNLVALHGGDVEARSDGIGHGSEFIVRLPLIAPPRVEPATQVQRTFTVPRRVLLVDDNVDAAQSMGALLEMHGHRVQCAHDGRVALELARATRPELALLDLGLPGMNGFDLARKLRAMPETRNTALIALTGYAQDEDRARSAAAGFDRHLVKPVEPDKLFAVIRELSARDQNPD